MRGTWVAGLVVVAVLGARSAGAQGECSELTLDGDPGTRAGCGDTRSEATLLVEDLNGTPGIDCPGTNCDGDSYTLSDSSDLIRVVLAGMHHDDGDDIGMQDCTGDVRWSLVETWQKLFEGTCTDSTCENAQHLWRLPDDDPGAQMPEIRVSAIWVVEALDVVRNGVSGMAARRPRVAVKELGLERTQTTEAEAAEAKDV